MVSYSSLSGWSPSKGSTSSWAPSLKCGADMTTGAPEAQPFKEMMPSTQRVQSEIGGIHFIKYRFYGVLPTNVR